MQKPCKYYDTVFLPKSQYIWRISPVYESTIYRGIDRGNVWIMTRQLFANDFAWRYVILLHDKAEKSKRKRVNKKGTQIHIEPVSLAVFAVL